MVHPLRNHDRKSIILPRGTAGINVAQLGRRSKQVKEESDGKAKGGQIRAERCCVEIVPPVHTHASPLTSLVQTVFISVHRKHLLTLHNFPPPPSAAQASTETLLSASSLDKMPAAAIFFSFFPFGPKSNNTWKRQQEKHCLVQLGLMVSQTLWLLPPGDP